MTSTPPSTGAQGLGPLFFHRRLSRWRSCDTIDVLGVRCPPPPAICRLPTYLLHTKAIGENYAVNHTCLSLRALSHREKPSTTILYYLRPRQLWLQTLPTLDQPNILAYGTIAVCIFFQSTISTPCASRMPSANATVHGWLST
jgi:hypothetical protein